MNKSPEHSGDSQDDSQDLSLKKPSGQTDQGHEAESSASKDETTAEFPQPWLRENAWQKNELPASDPAGTPDEEARPKLSAHRESDSPDDAPDSENDTWQPDRAYREEAEPDPDEQDHGSFSEAPAPVRYSFAGEHPLLTVRQGAPHSLCSRLFDGLALLPLLPLTVMLLLQTIFTLDTRELWFSDEIRHAAAFQALLDQGKWLILEMNGQPYPDKPPLYFLFLRGLYELLRTDGPMLHFSAAAVSALLYLWAALGLGRLAARVDRRTNLAAGILLLSAGYVMGVIHYARMDLLFSALILCSHIALYRAFVSPASRCKGMILGFGLAGLACLVKGPLGLAMPFCSILFFALWRGLPLRLFRPDFLVGLVAGLVPAALWLGAIYWNTGNTDFILNSLIKEQVVERALDTFHHKEAWHYYLLRLPLMALPWTLLLFFLPWERLPGRNMRAALAASRRPEGEGLAFLWSMVLSALVLLSLLSGKILIYFLPVLPALALLAARAVLALEGARAGLFRKSMSMFMLLGAVTLALTSLALFGLLPLPDIAGLPRWKLPANGVFYITSAILLLVSGLLWTVLRGNRPEGTLLIMALGATALGYPLAGLVAPDFDAVLSPKSQALLMRAYIQEGYAPASYKVYGGTYTYYAGKNIPALERLPVSGDAKMVVGMQRSRLGDWENKPACFEEVHSQWIESREYVLLACPAMAGLSPAAVPYKPAPDVLGALMKLAGIRFPAKADPPKDSKAEPKEDRPRQTPPREERASTPPSVQSPVQTEPAGPETTPATATGAPDAAKPTAPAPADPDAAKPTEPAAP